MAENPWAAFEFGPYPIKTLQWLVMTTNMADGFNMLLYVTSFLLLGLPGTSFAFIWKMVFVVALECLDLNHSELIWSQLCNLAIIL